MSRITNEFGVELKSTPLQEEIEKKMEAMRVHERLTINKWLGSIFELDPEVTTKCELLGYQDSTTGHITYYLVLKELELPWQLKALDENLEAKKKLLDSNHLHSLSIGYEDQSYKDDSKNKG